MFLLLPLMLGCGSFGDPPCPEVPYEPTGPLLSDTGVTCDLDVGQCATLCYTPACTETVGTCEACEDVRRWGGDHCASCVDDDYEPYLVVGCTTH